MNERADQTSKNKLRWMLLGIAGMLTLIGLTSLFVRNGFFGPSPRHLRDRWQAGDFDLTDEERKRLRGLPVEFASYNEKHADRTFEQKSLGSSHVLKREIEVERREQLAVFQKDPTRKVAVTSEEFRQFYQAYANQNHPVFITSDSILNAFHRIFEDSILKVEFRQLERLRKLFPTLEERLTAASGPTESDLDRAARRRAQLIIGVAHQLIDPNYEPDAEIRRVIREQTKRVESGSGRSMPDWLGKPRPSFLAIDYSRFTPEGLHSRSDALRRYYRAVRWLQTIPFYVDDDEHLVAFRMIGEAAKDTHLESFAETYRDFFGTTDDWDLRTLSSLELESAESLNSVDTIRTQLLRQLDAVGPPSRINDLATALSPPIDKEGVALRVLSAFRTPDAILFQSTAASANPAASVGLLLCTALGSDLARERLSESNDSDAIVKIDRANRLLDDDSVYGEYLKCLATLFKPIESSPGFMSTDRWQMKSCQTALGGWTQMRHTFALQVKQNAMILSQSEHVGSGFVEPNPEFFRRLARLASRIEKSLGALGAFEISYEQLRFRLNELARCFALIRVMQQEGLADEDLAQDDRDFVSDVYNKIGASNPLWWLGIDHVDEESCDLVLAALVQLSDCVERGELPHDRAARGAILESESSSNRVRWMRFVEICERLQDLASRQLDHQPHTVDDEYFITNYGEELARLLEYEAYSASDPSDDAMRCVRVLTRANGNHLHIAVARPQAIYVLYPHRGQQLLCRGAVFPYFEFSDDHLVNDESWKRRINAATPPARPIWLEPLYTDD